MIQAIGIDTVEIIRFTDWHNYPNRQLKRIFSVTEIEYCLSVTDLSAARFAIRFAAREALLKACSSFYPDRIFSLLHLCKHTEIKKNINASPYLHVAWDTILLDSPPPAVHLSMSHTRTTATSVVILY